MKTTDTAAQRSDAAFLRRKDDEHVSAFKSRVGMGGVIMEGQEIAAVVRYIEQIEASLATTPQTERGAFERDVKQLADWLLTDPQTGGKLRFSGPLEREFLGMSRVKMETKSGEAWTLTAGLKEGYLTATQRMANLNRIASEERESTREPSQDQLKEMAYLLELVPRGEVVCVQFLEVLRKQYRAAMEASGV